MSSTTEDSTQTASIVQTLCDSEECDVVLRFDDAISVPTGKYNGRSYQTDTLPNATLNATIQHASVDDEGMSLLCFARLEMEELDRLGIDPSVVETESMEGPPERCVVDINAPRVWDREPDTPVEEIKQAVEEGREKEVLPPWDGLPTATVQVARTEDCHKRSYESGYHTQYRPPTHKMGTLVDVRVK